MIFNETQSKHSTLTGSKVLDIRRLHAAGTGDTGLAKTFDVSRKTIYNIVRRNTWKNLPEPVTVSGYKGYIAYPDGRVFSKATGKAIRTVAKSGGPAVKMTNMKGSRKTVLISTLLTKHFSKAKTS